MTEQTAALNHVGVENSKPRQFLSLLLRAELSCNPFDRLLGQAWVLASVCLAWLAWPATRVLMPGAIGEVVTCAVAAAGLVLLYVVGAWQVEPRLFARAPRRWLMSFPRGQGGAYARVSRRRDAGRGGWMLFSVCAHPKRQGIGCRLMAVVCAEADVDHVVVSLVAVNRRAASFYRQFGFVQVRRELIGYYMIRPAR